MKSLSRRATTHRLTADLASRFVAIALGHVEREYPHILQHVLTTPAARLAPRSLHPAFFGSFDWHSCVHAHWMLARLLRRFPAIAQAEAVRARLDAACAWEAVAGEVAYFEAHAGFERPYGWAWLLMLAAELGRGGESFAAWRKALAPLSELIAARLRAWLPKADYPVRSGAHANTAFALILALDYARGEGDPALARLAGDKAVAWYGKDAACQAWEPSGDDFLSPALIEAQLMRRVLGRKAFCAWFGRFLPELADGRPATLFTPAKVSDRSDGKIAHLDGLNLSRAWCWRGLANAAPHGDPLAGVARAAAKRHLDASLAFVAGDYMGEHWLASFAVLALDADLGDQSEN